MPTPVERKQPLFTSINYSAFVTYVLCTSYGPGSIFSWSLRLRRFFLRSCTQHTQEARSVSQEIRFYSGSRWADWREPLWQQPHTVVCTGRPLRNERGEVNFPTPSCEITSTVTECTQSLSGVACDHPLFVCL